MAFKQYTLTLNGAAQRLSNVYGGAANVQPSAADDIPYRQIFFSADPASANPVYVGSDALVTAIRHAFSISPVVGVALGSVQSVSIGPFETGPLKLSDFWVVGTNAQRLMVGGVPY